MLCFSNNFCSTNDTEDVSSRSLSGETMAGAYNNKLQQNLVYLFATCYRCRVEGKKVFMGVAQIMLDDLDLSNIVIGWYKLFGTSSLVNVPPGGGKDKKKESTVWFMTCDKKHMVSLVTTG